MRAHYAGTEWHTIWTDKTKDTEVCEVLKKLLTDYPTYNLKTDDDVPAVVTKIKAELEKISIPKPASETDDKGDGNKKEGEGKQEDGKGAKEKGKEGEGKQEEGKGGAKGTGGAKDNVKGKGGKTTGQA